MSTAPNLYSLLEEALTQVPALSRLLLESTQDELQARPQYFALKDDWRRLRPRFTVDFESALIPLLQAARRGEDPLKQHRVGNLEGLSLVDEQQALQDVAVAHVIQTIEDQSKTELHQLNNFFAALRGTARARQSDNPLRPALFAQALYQSLFGIELDGQRRYSLMHAAATPMAKALHRLYESLCAQLRAAELTQLVASHASSSQDANALQRLTQARLQNEPATLDGLARRVQAHNSRPQGLMSTFGSTQAGGGVGAGAKPDMLSRLYDQILADPRLLPPMKALLARLQVAVVRLARGDTTLLRRQDHPAWQLLNRVAAHGMAFERGDDPRLQDFLRFMDAEVQLLIDAPMPSATLFEQVLKRVELHLSRQAQQRSERSATALAALEREQQRPQWLALVREQIAEQIAHSAPGTLGPYLHRFLLTSWAEVIVQAMVAGGHDAPQAAAQIDLVDRLLDSLQAPADDAARLRLRQSLPGLIQDLRAGCATIKLPQAMLDAVLQELMQLHSRLLSGQAPTPFPQIAIPETRPAPLDSKNPEELLQQLLTERESQLPEHWAHASVDRGQLPTVPVQLYDSPNEKIAQTAITSWMNALTLGSWYHLFVQSQWITAQIAWVSESQQFYLFVGQDADQRHSLTRGAIEKLLANGLITALDENGVLQRAVETLMQNLDDGA